MPHYYFFNILRIIFDLIKFLLAVYLKTAFYSITLDFVGYINTVSLYIKNKNYY